MRRLRSLLVSVVLLSGCTPRPVAIVLQPPAPPPSTVAAPMPAGGVPGMTIPARTADGQWPTPGRSLSSDGAVWHLRAALNVAALVCRDPGQGEAVVGAYNAMLTGRKAALAAAEARYAGEWRALGPADWRDRYDDAMTRAYNFYGQSFARPGFCAAAIAVLTDMAAVPDAGLVAFATARLPLMERPFVDFFTAYVAWRDGASTTPVMAVATAEPVVAPAPPTLATPQTRVVVAIPPRKPWLGVDPAIYRMP